VGSTEWGPRSGVRSGSGLKYHYSGCASVGAATRVRPPRQNSLQPFATLRCMALTAPSHAIVSPILRPFESAAGRPTPRPGLRRSGTMAVRLQGGRLDAVCRAPRCQSLQPHVHAAVQVLVLDTPQRRCSMRASVCSTNAAPRSRSDWRHGFPQGCIVFQEAAAHRPGSAARATSPPHTRGAGVTDEFWACLAYA